MLVERLIEHVRDEALSRRVEDVRVGIGYTSVMLDDNSCGMAFVFRNELGLKCGLIDEAGSLIGAKCKDIIQWAMDSNLVKASIGVSAINALLQNKLQSGFTQKNAMDVIDVRPEDTIGMIGYYKPVLDKYGSSLKKIYIFERSMTDDINMYPDWAEEMYLPECDVVIITGTTVVNKTIDHILAMCKNAREIVIMGPTTPLCPEVFKGYGVNLIAGVKVCDPKKVLDITSQGGGGHSFGNSLKKLCMRIW